MKRLALAALAAALAACGPAFVDSFADVSPVAQGRKGAVAVTVACDSSVEPGVEFPVLQVAFTRPGDDRPVVVHPIYQESGLPPSFSRTIMVELPPGRYAMRLIPGARRKWTYLLKIKNPGGAFASVDVRPGRVLALGAVRTHLDMKVGVDASDQVTVHWEDSISWDDSASARQATLDEARRNPDAQARGWLAVLDRRD